MESSASSNSYDADVAEEDVAEEEAATEGAAVDEADISASVKEEMRQVSGMPGYVSYEDLLEEAEAADREDVAYYDEVPVGGQPACYEKVQTDSSANLEKALGQAYHSDIGYYYVVGHEDIMYLIQKDGKELSLWEFRYFKNAPYAYTNVLKQIYKITSAKDIAEIRATAPTADNSDKGLRVQEEVGKITVTKRKKIRKFYKVLCNLTCLGADYEEIDTGFSDVPADGASPNENATRMGRYITIVLKDGTKIKSLKYAGKSEVFYENGSLAYESISSEDASAVNRILKIEK